MAKVMFTSALKRFFPSLKEERIKAHDVKNVLTEIERIDFEHQNLSTMHYMPFLGNDMYAIEFWKPEFCEHQHFVN